MSGAPGQPKLHRVSPTPKRCPACGAPLRDGSASLSGLSSCAQCGAEFDAAAPPPPPVAGPPARLADVPAPARAAAPLAEPPEQPARFHLEEVPGELRIDWRWAGNEAGPAEDFALPLTAALALATIAGLWLLSAPLWAMAAFGLAWAAPLYLLLAHRVGRTRIFVRGRAIEVRYGPLPFPDFTGVRRVEAPTAVSVWPRARPPRLSGTFDHVVSLEHARGTQPIASFSRPEDARWLQHALERRLGLGRGG